MYKTNVLEKNMSQHLFYVIHPKNIGPLCFNYHLYFNYHFSFNIATICNTTLVYSLNYCHTTISVIFRFSYIWL
uniref:Uncharacterized protein n=1 Tax=Octopus bimaculoides TaxID=37653 RepID=A0A0L8GZD9_OCTBM